MTKASLKENRITIKALSLSTFQLLDSSSLVESLKNNVSKKICPNGLNG